MEVSDLIEHFKAFVAEWEVMPTVSRVDFFESDVSMDEKLASSTFQSLTFRQQRRLVIDAPTMDLMKCVSRVVDLILPKIRFRWEWEPVCKLARNDQRVEQLFTQACPVGSDPRIVKLLKNHFVDTFVSIFAKQPTRDKDKGQTTLRPMLVARSFLSRCLTISVIHFKSSLLVRFRTCKD